MPPREWLTVYLKGICMGAADAVPGVSGGTIALVTGIYERLIAAITALDPLVVLTRLRTSHTSEGRAALVTELRAMDVPFLLALGGGVVTAVVTISRVMDRALETVPALTYAFFFGLIAASAVALYGHVAVDTLRRIGVAVVAVVVAFLVTGVTASGSAGHSPPGTFLAGAVAITAMVLPGVSGAFLLVLLGQYEHLVSTLSAFVDGLLALPTGGDPAALAGPAVTVGAFCAGAVVGLFSVAYAIRWALEHYREATLTFLVSLMVGALRLPVVRVVENTPRWTPTNAVAVATAALLGAGLVLVLDRYTDDLEY